jgi:tetratricopeptide (TPR) repeat protein
MKQISYRVFGEPLSEALPFWSKNSVLILTAIVFFLAGSLLPETAAAKENVMRRALFEGTDLPQQTLPRFGKDSAACTQNWSMYDEFFGHRAYHLAYEPWKHVFENCPLVTINIYVHGVTIVRYQYDNETDPAKKEEWLDLLRKVFDQRIQYFGNEGFVLGRKATAIYQLKPDNVQELFDLTERSIELSGMSAEATVLSINFLSAVMLEHAGKLGSENIVDRYIRAEEIIEYNLGQDPSNNHFFQNTKTTIQGLFQPYGSCENLAAVFASRIEANPEDPELLKHVAGMLNNAGCNGSELFYNITEKLYRILPDAASAFLLGRMENSRANYEAAIRYFQEAADRYLQEDPAANQENIFRAYWLMAEISYRQLRQMPQSRGFARKALEAKPNDGRPLMLIGEMYAASARDCGNDDFTKKAAFWAAVDKFNLAASTSDDPAVKERAQQLADTYRQYFPDGEEIFFHGFTQGDQYRVECWINETTTIRAR